MEGPCLGRQCFFRGYGSLSKNINGKYWLSPYMDAPKAPKTTHAIAIAHACLS